LLGIRTRYKVTLDKDIKSINIKNAKYLKVLNYEHIDDISEYMSNKDFTCLYDLMREGFLHIYNSVRTINKKNIGVYSYIIIIDPQNEELCPGYLKIREHILKMERDKKINKVLK